MTDKFEKEVKAVLKNLDEKLAAVDNWIDKYPQKTTINTHTAEVVSEENRILREYEAARDAYLAFLPKAIKTIVNNFPPTQTFITF